MKRFPLTAFSAIVVLTATLFAQSNPVPFVNQPLIPTAAFPGSTAFTLTVNGTGFISGSTVNWNGSLRATTFVSSSQLTASISAADVATAGTRSITVTSPGAGNVSNIVFFPVTGITNSVSFGKQDYTTGTRPLFITTADLNGDGKLDLAIGDQTAKTVSILMGNGDGTFQPKQDYAVGTDPYAIVSADFNRDGKPDLAVANFGEGTVSILIGNGDGSFQSSVIYSAGNGPFWLVAADLNRDGYLDLAVADYQGNTISVLLGNGNGTFQPAVQYPVGPSPSSIVAGDLNGDGKLDLIVVENSDISILLGNGDGTFQPRVDYPSTSGPYMAKIADFNQDGKLDVVTVNFDGAVSFLAGNGDGTIQSPVNYSALGGPISLDIGDLNGDGKLDVLATGQGTPGEISALLGNGNGSFQTPIGFCCAGNEPQGTVIGDFNNDGRLDAAVTNLDDGTVSVLLQLGNVSLSSQSLAFGNQNVGISSSPQIVTVTNSSVLRITISGISVTGTNITDFTQTNNCGTFLAVGATCQITVTFTPTMLGARSANITISDNAAGSPQIVTLTGTGVSPSANLSRSSLQFGNQVVGTTSNGRDVILKNTGTAALQISSVTASGNFTQTNTCGASVAVGASCTITAKFTPTIIGDRTGAITINDNAGPPTQTIHLFGTGTDVSLSTLSLTFAPQKVGTTSPPSSIRLTNVGRSTLTFSAFTLSGANATDFAQGNNCGSSLAGGHSCTISVTFTPSATGTRNASLAFTDNGGGSPQNVTLQGTGK